MFQLTRQRALILLLPIMWVWQASPLALLPWFGWRLDPSLVLAIAGGLLEGPRFGLWFGLIAGGGQDLLLGAGLLYGITKALAGLAAGAMQPHIYRLDALSLGMVGLVWTLGEGLLVALYLLAHGRTAVWDHYAALSLPLGVAHALLLVVLYAWLMRLPGAEREERVK
jgi:LytS/YehU family sensor histidine kinase